MRAACAGFVLGALTLWSVWGSAVAPPGRKGNPWTPAVPEGAEQARRIVSTNVGIDEILLALLPPERIAALTRLADDPDISNVVEEARAVAGRVHAPDVERILALTPDLVVVPPYTRREVTFQLESAGVSVLRMPDCLSVEDIRVHIRLLARTFGVAERGEELIARMDGVLEEVRARTDGLPRPLRPRVLFTSANGYTQGKGTPLDLFLEAAGAVNAAAEAGLVGRGILPVETALALDPDVLLVSGYSGKKRARGFEPTRQLAEDPAWQNASAVRAGRVYAIPGRYLLSTSHHVTKTAEAIARAIHPEAFER